MLVKGATAQDKINQGKRGACQAAKPNIQPLQKRGDIESNQSSQPASRNEITLSVTSNKTWIRRICLLWVHCNDIFILYEKVTMVVSEIETCTDLITLGRRVSVTWLRYKYGCTLAQFSCLTAPSHYLIQCWFLIKFDLCAIHLIKWTLHLSWTN